jgi:hypothetical protein
MSRKRPFSAANAVSPLRHSQFWSSTMSVSLAAPCHPTRHES